MAIQFDGTSYLSQTPSGVSALPITLAGWVKLPADATAYVSAVGSADGTNLVGLFLNQSEGRVVANVRVDGDWSNLVGDPYLVGAWQHVAAVFAADGSRSLYQQGVQTGSDQTQSSPGAMAVSMIGARPPANVLMSGELAEVAIWSAALEAKEVSLLASGLSPALLPGRSSQLSGYQSLVSKVNESIEGQPFTATGVLAKSAHPRVRYRKRPAAIPTGARLIGGVDAAQAAMAGATAASAAVLGTEVGVTFPFAEAL